MEYLDCYAPTSSDNAESEHEDDVDDQVSLDNFIEDGPQIENNLPDYHPLRNITRSMSDTEEGAFPESDVEAFLDENTRAINYCLCSEDEEEDVFDETSKTIDNFKLTLMIPIRKDSTDSLFYLTCYAIHYMQTKKVRNVLSVWATN